MTRPEPTPAPLPDRAAAPKPRLDPATPEVAGHAMDPGAAPDPTATAAEAAGDEAPEVEGHMHHPDLERDLLAIRHRDALAEAERRRQADEARQGQGGSPGVLDRLRRRGDGTR